MAFNCSKIVKNLCAAIKSLALLDLLRLQRLCALNELKAFPHESCNDDVEGVCAARAASAYSPALMTETTFKFWCSAKKLLFVRISRSTSTKSFALNFAFFHQNPPLFSGAGELKTIINVFCLWPRIKLLFFHN
jgi:hypothetical protein